MTYKRILLDAWIKGKAVIIIDSICVRHTIQSTYQHIPTYTNYTGDRSKMVKLFRGQMPLFESVPSFIFERNTPRCMDHWFWIL